jgi:hypothetical protein
MSPVYTVAASDMVSKRERRCSGSASTYSQDHT